MADLTVDEWDRVMAVNLRSMFLTCKQVIPAMLEQGGGSIVNTASISAYIGQEVDGRSSAVYNVTKAAARQLTTSLASRYAGGGIRVNAVAPGSTRTEIIRSWRPDYTEDDLDAVLRRLCEGDAAGPRSSAGGARERDPLPRER
ncbi:MAG: SDR family NAD(P)-dependent oxidoreductase [Actinomycetia bacterium]|nr:SDR family NAD(P)-dependent oxidoreductase [Actinomycetes bacterium]